MPEHRIRLRGAWDRLDPTGQAAISRVDLPTTWSDADLAGQIQLRRRFGCPRADLNHEAVELELADIPGIEAVQLNGRNLTLDRTKPGLPIRIDVGTLLLNRNVLELQFEPAGSDQGRPWGAIALVIVGRLA